MCNSCYVTWYAKQHPQHSSKEWFKRNPDRYRYHIRKKGLKLYGITPEDYDVMWTAQEGKCANPRCGSRFPMVADNYREALQVDHCHRTGAIRALLCPPCNRALGDVDDDAERLAGLVEYLALH